MSNHNIIRTADEKAWHVLAPSGGGYRILATVVAEFEARRIARAMDALVERERGEEERRREAKRADRQLQAYTLRYYADQMRADLEISAEDGAVLWLKSTAERLDPIETVE